MKNPLSKERTTLQPQEEHKLHGDGVSGGIDNNTQESTVWPEKSLGDVEVSLTGKDWVELDEAPY